MRNQYTDPALDLRRAAAVVRLSHFHLSRLLKRATGMGFAQHLRSTRVTHAEALLRLTDLSVKEIAATVGYGNTNALDRNFKATFAVTPTTYRLRMGEPPAILANADAPPDAADAALTPVSVGADGEQD